MAEEKQSIVLFPFMAQGHIIPFLALALNLEQNSKNYNITIINTPHNIQKLEPSLPPNSQIKLLTIPFISSDHNLPPNTENTDTVPYNLVIKLLQASLSLQSPFKNIIKNILTQQPQKHKLCIISDIFFGWTSIVAKELGVFHLVFSGCSGFGLACYYSLWMNLPHRFTNSDDFPLSDFPEARLIQRNQLPNNISEADGFDDWSIFQRKNLSNWVNSDGILFNSVSEFDSVGLNYFVKKLQIPVWAIGPVVLSTGNGSRGKGGGINPKIWKSCEVKYEDIVEKIELVMSESGLKIRENACKIKDMIRNAVRDENEDGIKGSSVRGIDEFLSAAGKSNKVTLSE
ncbi:hypothetical protein TSUD_109650 [Trifolium subterraneum]|uniref:UDP-glycosyltransferases domain-containing protein n=1 Tax=Trifolium subterraneum TaxID=3900 RepID=A0A2Z6LIU2_TRISU|nr:hypothetical protein TSUD_109650 [Trifolium subterraneum]